jgi:hypothetical protein
LRASISFVVIGFAASIGTAGAQYLPPEPPPMGYPPPAYYPYRGYPPPAYYGYRGYPPPAYYRANPSAPFHATDQDAGGESYEDEYDRPYPPQRMFGDAPGGMRSEPLAPPAVSPQDRGTAVAALPPDYQPEQGPTKEIPPALPTRPRPRPRLGLPNPSSHEVPKANFWEETAEYYAIELLS